MESTVWEGVPMPIMIDGEEEGKPVAVGQKGDSCCPPEGEKGGGGRCLWGKRENAPERISWRGRRVCLFF